MLGDLVQDHAQGTQVGIVPSHMHGLIVYARVDHLLDDWCGSNQDDSGAGVCLKTLHHRINVLAVFLERNQHGLGRSAKVLGVVRAKLDRHQIRLESQQLRKNKFLAVRRGVTRLPNIQKPQSVFGKLKLEHRAKKFGIASAVRGD